MPKRVDVRTIDVRDGALGAHALDLSAPSGQAHQSAEIAAPSALGGSPFRAGHVAAGWRIDWLTPGGGEQTTLVFDASEPAR